MKKIVVLGLVVLFVIGSLSMVACGSNDEAGKQTMREALTVVEADIAQLTGTFSSGQGTGADIKAAIASVKPHWDAVVAACADVKGADAAKATQVYTDVETAVVALSDTAGLAEFATLLPAFTALTTFEGELRKLVGGETTTTVAP